MNMTTATAVSTTQARDILLALATDRGQGATTCPSEVARAMAANLKSDEWREYMPVVHVTVDQLLREKRIKLSWKGRDLPARKGPYRISIAK